MKVGTILRKLYGGKNLSIRSFMHPPTSLPGSSSLLVSCSPVVYFSYDPKLEYGKQRPKDTSFKMNPRNQFRVTQFFREILSWFDSPEFRDLFMTDEHENRLMVNMDYREVNALVKGSRYDSQAMMAVPTVIEIDSVQHEGCVLYINRSNYALSLIDSDIEEIYGILQSFSFQAEAQLLLYIAQNPELVSKQEMSYDGRPKVQW